MNQDKLLEFSDVLIEPKFSFVRSRKDVDVSTDFLGMKLSLPVIPSNMDTVSSPALCRALADYGSIGTLHRFWSIEENVRAFVESISNGISPIVSIGIGDKELERARALYNVGASRFMLDVAHAANIAVVEMYNQLLAEFPSCYFIVGDFGTGNEIKEFIRQAAMHRNDLYYTAPYAVKVGIGIGSVCHTRNVTGVGNYALSCLLDCASYTEEKGIKLILDGGIREIGDISKALIAGADIVMSGSMFAGTEEAGAIEKYTLNKNTLEKENKFKEYRGSASQESYEVQNKIAPWRCAEGTSILVPSKGPVINVLNSINGGLRSACSYVGAFNLNELKANGKFQYTKVQVNA